MKITLITIACLVGLLGLGWLFAANGWLMSKAFMPRMEQVRRDTFVQSQAYNEGQAQQLEDFQQQYITATPDQRAMLRTVILHRYATEFDFRWNQRKVNDTERADTLLGQIGGKRLMYRDSFPAL